VLTLHVARRSRPPPASPGRPRPPLAAPGRPRPPPAAPGRPWPPLAALLTAHSSRPAALGSRSIISCWYHYRLTPSKGRRLRKGEEDPTSALTAPPPPPPLLLLSTANQCNRWEKCVVTRNDIRGTAVCVCVEGEYHPRNTPSSRELASTAPSWSPVLPRAAAGAATRLKSCYRAPCPAPARPRHPDVTPRHATPRHAVCR
jgi:hypothetical protein